MAVKQIDDLGERFLKEWAQVRVGSDTESVLGQKWVGSITWGTSYVNMLHKAQKAGAPRPPAFQDGLARPEQLWPGSPGSFGAVWADSIPKGGDMREARRVRVGEEDWTYWLLRCGRGYGKTRVGAESVIHWARRGISPILLAGPTSLDVRASMVEGPGESAILKICPRDFYPNYEPSKRKLTFPNGVECQLLSAEEPERFRGVQFVKAWLDEMAAWTLLKECWDQIRYVMRVKRPGVKVQLVITTTPRTKPLIRQLSQHPRCALTVRPSYDNMGNLADEYRELIAEDEGTRQGEQEIHGKILESVEGALWSEDQLDATTLSYDELERLLEDDGLSSQPPLESRFDRQVLGVDPPGGETDCGIVRAALLQRCPYGVKGCRGHLFILGDHTEIEHPSPERWANAVCRAYWDYKCDNVIAEVNYGGTMVQHTIRTAPDGAGQNVPVKVVTATRGKRLRAEPIATLWAGDHPRAHIVGRMAGLRSEMTTWVPDKGMLSPNRLDAMVWAATELMLGHQAQIVRLADMSRASIWK